LGVYLCRQGGGTLLIILYVQKTDHSHSCLADYQKSNTRSGLSSGRSMRQLVLFSGTGITTLKAKIVRKTRDS